MTLAGDVEVVFLDGAGVIVSVNPAWDDFCRRHGGDPRRSGVGVSYLEVCVAAGADPVAGQVADAVRSAISGTLTAPARMLVPCAGTGGTGWFDLMVHSRFDADGRVVGASVALSPVPVRSPAASLPPGDGLVPGVTSLACDRVVDLTGRVGDVIGERDRVAALLTATRSLAAQLDLSQVLEQLVVAARDVVDARYAALGVLGSDGTTLAQFIHSGMPAEVVAGIAAAGHPAMASFLGVPIRIRDTVFGNIYLTDKRDGGEFTARDEDTLVSLAATAAVVIDNARLHQEITWRDRWREAAIAVTNATLADPGSSDLLSLIAAQARGLARADNLSIGQSLPGGTTMAVRAADGAQARPMVGTVNPVAGSVLELVQRAGSFTSRDAFTDDRIPHVCGALPQTGPVLAVPLTLPGPTIGVITATRRRGREPFGEAEEFLLAHFAQQASVALELGRARASAERLQVLEERHRIARDVHDNTLSRLLGIGLSLQGILRHTTAPDLAARLDPLIDELDTAMSDLRTTIYTDAPTPGATAGGPVDLAAELDLVIHEAGTALGFTPTIAIDRDLDPRDLGPDRALAQHLVAVLREALTNIARHAGAHAVHIAVTGGARIELVVTDDGRGLPDRGHAISAHGGHGLANMADRARSVAGAFSISDNPAGGTTLRWSAPPAPTG
jgi:signal transduction histidine kinase